MAVGCCILYRNNDQRFNWFRWLYAPYDRSPESLVSQLTYRRRRQRWRWFYPGSTLWCDGRGYRYRYGRECSESHAFTSSTCVIEDAAVPLGCPQTHQCLDRELVVHGYPALST